MSYDPIIELKFAAFAVGQRAKVNDLEQWQVDEMRAKAERYIANPQDVLRRAVIGFATRYELDRHNPTQLYEIGTALVDLVDTLNVPVPPAQDRKDIYG
ncbi:hypothetical protein KUV49_09620 [Roseovarius atlanticus]|nr:hypothetical protein [Roseovarius atlanticus]